MTEPRRVKFREFAGEESGWFHGWTTLERGEKRLRTLVAVIEDVDGRLRLIEPPDFEFMSPLPQ